VMSTSARHNILMRLRTAGAPRHLPPSGQAPASIVEPAQSLETCRDRFVAEATALGVECVVARSAAEVRARVADLLRDATVLSWDAAELPYEIGGTLTHATWGHSPRAEQAAADVGLTGCDAAIAETGSLAMISAPGRSRIVSLLPPIHVAIVRSEDLVFSMGEFFARRQDRLTTAASCTVISGPSRTADIELTLTLGIHGPGRVAVIVGP